MGHPQFRVSSTYLPVLQVHEETALRGAKEQLADLRQMQHRDQEARKTTPQSSPFL